jgi:hypothetical protein
VAGRLSEPSDQIPLAADPLCALGGEPLDSREDQERRAG